MRLVDGSRSYHRVRVGAEFCTCIIVITWRHILLIYLWQLLDLRLVSDVARLYWILDSDFSLIWIVVECAAGLLANYF